MLTPYSVSLLSSPEALVDVLVTAVPAPVKLEAILYNSSRSPAAMGWNSVSRFSRADLLVMILMS